MKISGFFSRPIQFVSDIQILITLHVSYDICLSSQKLQKSIIVQADEVEMRW